MSASVVAKLRWWDDENVDLVLGIPNSAIALALVKVAARRTACVMPTAAATSALTGKALRHAQYASISSTTPSASPLPASSWTRWLQPGGVTWFFITRGLCPSSLAVKSRRHRQFHAEAAGGIRWWARVRHALNPSQDFSSYVLQADASKAKGLMFANRRRRRGQRHEAGRLRSV